MDSMTREQDLAVSYINGNISYVKKELERGAVTHMALCDELYDMLNEEDYRLFLKRMG